MTGDRKLHYSLDIFRGKFDSCEMMFLNEKSVTSCKMSLNLFFSNFHPLFYKISHLGRNLFKD